jgi:rhamnosyltransferase
MLKRLCIFIFYDKQGIVDDYVPYFLSRLKPHITELVIVANGDIQKNELKKIKPYAKHIFMRKNLRYEPVAVKDVLFKFCGFSKILEFDELLICNDSFYGPFSDLGKIFHKMDNENYESWGITEQIYFYNIKRNLLHSKYFLKNCESYTIAKFLKAGFSYANYIEAENLDCPISAPVSLLKKGCPFVKREAFYVSPKHEQIDDLMQFIKNNIKYDTELIWQNLLRIASIGNIRECISLQYIFPKDVSISNYRRIENKKIAVIVHLFYTDLIYECLAYLDNVPKFIDIIVTTSKKEITEIVQKYFNEKRKIEIRLVENRGRDVAALFVHCKDIIQKYDYLCFTHDKKESGILTKIGAASFRFLLWENTLASEHYIKNIIYKFDSEPRLGFLNVPYPLLEPANLSNSWWDHNTFSIAKKMFKDLKLNFNLSSDIPVLAVGTAFWCKTKILKPLLNFSIKDFPKEPLPKSTISHALERIFPFVAQDQGYYSGIMLTDSYAQMRINYLELSQREIGKETEVEKILLFVKIYSELYIYGAGEVAKRIVNIFKRLDIRYKGFIVTYKEKSSLLNHPIYELSEIKFNKNTGIILGLSKEHSEQVLRILQKKNVDKNRILRIY